MFLFTVYIKYGANYVGGERWVCRVCMVKWMAAELV